MFKKRLMVRFENKAVDLCNPNWETMPSCRLWGHAATAVQVAIRAVIQTAAAMEGRKLEASKPT